MIITDVSSIYTFQTARLSWENIGPRKTHFLAYQVTGRYDHTVNGKLYAVSANHLFFINQRDSYTVKCFEKGYSICISFSADTDLDTSVWDMRANPVVYNLFTRLTAIKNLDDKGNYYLALSLLYEILSVVFKTEHNATNGDAPKHHLDVAVNYLLEHFADEDLRTEKLASLCGVSEKHFRTLFKKRFQVTPTQYIIHLRLNNAVKFLTYGGFTVAEIAEMVGIPDVYYFSKLFKSRFGVSPSKYVPSP